MTSIKKTILTNTAWLSFAKIFNNIISYILIVAIARFLGDVGLGQYSFVFAFTGLIFIFGDMGLDYLMIKEVSRNKKKAQYYFENILSINLLPTSLPCCNLSVRSGTRIAIDTIEPANIKTRSGIRKAA